VGRWDRSAPPSSGLRRAATATNDRASRSTGASDFTHPGGTAEPREGGYAVSGRKVFCSQAPAGDLLASAAVLDEEVLVFFAPMHHPVRVLDTWDTLGMRATASHDVVLEDVPVPDSQVVGRRPLGKLDASLRANRSSAARPRTSPTLRDDRPRQRGPEEVSPDQGPAPATHSDQRAHQPPVGCHGQGAVGPIGDNPPGLTR
jgi:hypothetical protein